MLSGRKPPFRLLVRAVHGDGRVSDIGHAVSEGFVVRSGGFCHRSSEGFLWCVPAGFAIAHLRVLWCVPAGFATGHPGRLTVLLAIGCSDFEGLVVLSGGIRANGHAMRFAIFAINHANLEGLVVLSGGIRATGHAMRFAIFAINYANLEDSVCVLVVSWCCGCALLGLCGTLSRLFGLEHADFEDTVVYLPSFCPWANGL
jgi:hypothetical protein